MDDFRGGKFIVGSDIRADEQRRMANEFMRNQNESQRLNSENNRNAATSNALGIANNSSRSNFLTQIGLFTAVVLTIIILTVIAILAYEKAYNNQSLVPLDNIRELTLSDLTITDKATMKNLTVTEDINVGDDLITTGGISVNEGISVGGEAIFYDEVWAKKGVSIDAGLSVGSDAIFYDEVWTKKGVSIDAGLSVGSDAIFYDEVWAKKGVSIDAGLSVGSDAIFYDEVWAKKGVSIDAGLSVSGITNLYNSLISNSGISTSAGLSVGGTARIDILKPSRKYTILTKNLTDEGICGSGYQLTSSDGGTTYIIQNKNSDGTSVHNTFLLPDVSESYDGLTYDFLWTDNESSVKKPFEITLADVTSTQNLYGNVTAGRDGTSVITMTLTGNNNAKVIGNTNISDGQPTQFHYSGKVYPGSKLTCTYVENNWQLYGALGVSGDHINENGFVNTRGLPWLIGGLSNNNFIERKYIGSNTGLHFYNLNSNLDTLVSDTDIWDIEYGISSDGTSIWNFGSGRGILYSINGVSFFSSTGETSVYSSLAYGTSNGSGRWNATSNLIFSGEKSLLFSNDGISWQSCTGASFGIAGARGNGVTYGLSSDGTSLRVVVGTDSYQDLNISTKNLLFSQEGISWQDCTGVSFTKGEGKAVAYGLSDDYSTGIWAAVGQVGSGTSSLIYSLNGKHWEFSRGANFGNGQNIENKAGIAYGLSSNGTSGIWVATNKNSVDSTANILYSLDGMSWEKTSGVSFGSGTGLDVKFGQDSSGNGLWLATGKHNIDNDSNILSSRDGINWEKLTSGNLLTGGEGGITIGFNKLTYPNPGNVVGL